MWRFSSTSQRRKALRGALGGGTEPNYPPDLALSEMRDKKGFKCAVVERAPLDLDYDEFTLECGHKQVMDSRLLEPKIGNTWHCPDCAREWLEKAQEE